MQTALWGGQAAGSQLAGVVLLRESPKLQAVRCVFSVEVVQPRRAPRLQALASRSHNTAASLKGGWTTERRRMRHENVGCPLCGDLGTDTLGHCAHCLVIRYSLSIARRVPRLAHRSMPIGDCLMALRAAVTASTLPLPLIPWSAPIVVHGTTAQTEFFRLQLRGTSSCAGAMLECDDMSGAASATVASFRKAGWSAVRKRRP